MLADLARVLDPALIASDAGLVLDDWQARLMRSTAPRILLLTARQCGKSTTVALVACNTALSEPGALILLVSPSQRQSGELFRTVLGFLKQMNADLRYESVLRCELRNGSRVVSLPGEESTVRGYSAPSLILLDEASRIPDQLYQACRPMMATNPSARIICLSTPKGRRGFFAEAWLSDDMQWQRVRVGVEQCPRISQEFLAQERRALGDLAFREEYGLEFLDAEDSVFSADAISAAFIAGQQGGVTRLWA